MKFQFGLKGVGYGPENNGLAVFFNPQLVYQVNTWSFQRKCCYILYWRYWYGVFFVGWLSAQLGGERGIWMGSFLVSQGPRIPHGLLGQWAGDFVSLVSCCALFCSCLVRQTYFIPLFVLFHPKLNSAQHWGSTCFVVWGLLIFLDQISSIVLFSLCCTGKTSPHFFHCSCLNSRIVWCNCSHTFWDRKFLWKFDAYKWQQLLGSSNSVFTVHVRFAANSSQENLNIQGENSNPDELLKDVLPVYLRGKAAICNPLYLKSLFPKFYWEWLILFET